MTCGFSASADRTGKARATAEEPHSTAGSSTRETSSKLEVVSALESRIEPIAKARIVSTASATVMASDAKALEARERNKGRTLAMEQIPFEMIYGRPRSATQTSDTIDRNRAIGTAHRNMSARVSDQRVAPTETAEDGAAMFMSELLSGDTGSRDTDSRDAECSRAAVTGAPAARSEERASAVPKTGRRLRRPREGRPNTLFLSEFQGQKNLLAGHTS
jgi:hypothetical protein